MDTNEISPPIYIVNGLTEPQKKEITSSADNGPFRTDEDSSPSSDDDLRTNSDDSGNEYSDSMVIESNPFFHKYIFGYIDRPAKRNICIAVGAILLSATCFGGYLLFRK